MYRGEIQTRNLGMAVESWNDDGKKINDFLTLFCCCGFTYHANSVDNQNSFHDSDLSGYSCDVAGVSKGRLVYL